VSLQGPGGDTSNDSCETAESGADGGGTASVWGGTTGGGVVSAHWWPRRHRHGASWGRADGGDTGHGGVDVWCLAGGGNESKSSADGGALLSRCVLVSWVASVGRLGHGTSAGGGDESESSADGGADLSLGVLVSWVASVGRLGHRRGHARRLETAADSVLACVGCWKEKSARCSNQVQEITME